ncbi:MAG: hypothetical protein DWQ34_27200 [Planctomycetota bacterium]|nr:MAG: hypothetical protein DWQ29_17955 [Planctomycetota bacterium]REJ86467.1 MAG: hypothetical protein DWQ34_27200 [Planctomycetota bacterium]REK28057.1 MAG: hypothetical protein DWQ41_06495 [Planctomycetota bacterium]REK37584.1 MAG: hypothetical protein DWQ45_06180 [Planctomycetota bacterium]
MKEDYRTRQIAAIAPAPTTTGLFRLVTGLMAGVLIGYFLLPLVAPRGWGETTDKDRRQALLAQFNSRDEAIAWLASKADSLERSTRHLANLSPPPLERRELTEIREHLQQVRADTSKKIDADIMWRAESLSNQLATVVQAPRTVSPPPARGRVFVRPRIDE